MKNRHVGRFLVITVFEFLLVVFETMVTDLLGRNDFLHPYGLESPPRDIQSNHMVLISG